MTITMLLFNTLEAAKIAGNGQQLKTFSLY